MKPLATFTIHRSASHAERKRISAWLTEQKQIISHRHSPCTPRYRGRFMDWRCDYKRSLASIQLHRELTAEEKRDIRQWIGVQQALIKLKGFVPRRRLLANYWDLTDVLSGASSAA